MINKEAPKPKEQATASGAAGSVPAEGKIDTQDAKQAPAPAVSADQPSTGSNASS